MSHRSPLLRVMKSGRVGVVLLFCVVPAVRAQEAPSGQRNPQDVRLVETLSRLQEEVRQLGSMLVEIRADADRTRGENETLRKELHETRAQLAKVERGLDALRVPPATLATPPARSPDTRAERSEETVEDRLAKLQEDQQLLSAKVDDQYQTKVESASKYRMKLSGVVLMNVFGNRGTVDNQDLPNLALERRPLDSSGDFGATVRQSELGLEVFGPRLGGAKTSASLQTDFFGGLPNTLDGANSGIVRMRTATVRFDWSRTSLVVGQDSPFFSPLSPTSLATVAWPAFAYAGNLWTWIPQVRVDHRLTVSEDSSFSFQAGILDPLSGEPPYNPFYRSPQAGERSRQPGYGTRVSWSRGAFGQSITLGAGGYYSRQNWGYGRQVDAWAGTADWKIPFERWLVLAGEFYRGRGLGGFGGGVGRSVLYNGNLTDPTTTVLGLHSTGGWAQLKFKPGENFEINGAFGEDNPSASDLHRFSENQSYFDPTIARNESALVNFIFRPRSDLLLALEYRRLETFSVYETKRTADHLNLSIGVLF